MTREINPDRVLEEKQTIRKEIYQRLGNKSTQSRKEESRRIKRKLFSLNEFEQSGCVVFYVSMDEEVHTHRMIDESILMGKKVGVPVSGDLFDIRAKIELRDAKSVRIEIGNKMIIYNAEEHDLNGASVKPEKGKIKMQILIDRSVVEICANDGRAFITRRMYPGKDIKKINVFSNKGTARLISLTVYELKSIWEEK